MGPNPVTIARDDGSLVQLEAVCLIGVALLPHVASADAAARRVPQISRRVSVWRAFIRVRREP